MKCYYWKYRPFSAAKWEYKSAQHRNLKMNGKVKSIKRPKVDANQLNEMHANSNEWAGVKIEKKEEEQKEEAFV